MEGYARVRTAVLRGVEAVPVSVEASVDAGGVPGIALTGFSGRAVELPSLLRCAMRAGGYEVPHCRVVLNMVGGHGSGASHEGVALACIAAVLAACGQIPAEWAEGPIVCGDVDLGGAALPPRHVTALRSLAEREGAVLVTAPCAPALAASCDHRIAERVGSLSAEPRLLPHAIPVEVPSEPIAPALSDVAGNGAAKRALAIAAAGGFGVLMLASGRDSVARALAEGAAALLPPLGGADRALAVAARESLYIDASMVAAGAPAFAAVDPYMSLAGVVGGGRPVRPGAVTLAHGGTLLIERADRMQSAVLAALARCREDGAARIVRADGLRVLPSRFMPVLVAPPCPCGGFGGHGCACSSTAIERYRASLNAWRGKLWEIVVSLDSEQTQAVSEERDTDLAAAVARARAARARRAAEPSASEVAAECARFTRPGRDDGLTLRVARTIADMDGAKAVGRDHLYLARTISRPL